MFEYANGFKCAVNKSKNEFAITFIQQYPSIDENGNIARVDSSNVTSVFIPLDCADGLADAIHELLNRPE